MSSVTWTYRSQSRTECNRLPPCRGERLEAFCTFALCWFPLSLRALIQEYNLEWSFDHEPDAGFPGGCCLNSKSPSCPKTWGILLLLHIFASAVQLGSLAQVTQSSARHLLKFNGALFFGGGGGCGLESLHWLMLEVWGKGEEDLEDPVWLHWDLAAALLVTSTSGRLYTSSLTPPSN